MAQTGVDLKSEDDVKEYLERLGIEYRFGCYYEKNGKACDLLGSFMDQVNGDYQKAFKLYQTACDEYKYGHSCQKAGSYLYAGRAVPRDIDKAYEYWRKGCDTHATEPHAKACFNAGLLDSLEENTKLGGVVGRWIDAERKHAPDQLRALDLLKKSCDMDKNPEAEGCHRYSSMLLTGVENLIKRDPAKALPYAAKACDMGVLAGCVNASIIYKTGDGVEKNERYAKIYADIARDINDQYAENKERTRFQEGAESGTEVPL